MPLNYRLDLLTEDLTDTYTEEFFSNERSNDTRNSM